MKIDRMELLGVVVTDLDEAVERYTRLFGLTFHIFTPGESYPLADAIEINDRAAQIPAGGRIAMDTSGMFELIELPDQTPGFRNIHYRVDDIEAAKAHFIAEGMTVVRDLYAGPIREVIFDGDSFGGIRVCLMQYDGPSFAEVATTGPAPVPGA